ncbi:hypothetical protein BABINDRAFT_159656 [Babjeviella inositovora NRRL Y-12698]|uniref:Respiratory growth induced protein 1 n=1 Tax=Babjeviella inositovora NRRL Y-12698 TaxID=984486 RepID=A0A1E3QZV0_9ASCO|nr:uncharacterized protein BABINDRAFT_159656 [Babjeviella inositovora NRRL Y-12698]ODQ83219.1 hypothetical protein BABINDRAFT_159656 [Babjeviella inositovora NRRL Y-12698]
MKKKVRRSSSAGSFNINEIGPAPRRPSQIPPVREFDELISFEQYLQDETWDNEFDFVHAKLKYYPPFIMAECKNDPEKIKDTMNKKSRKFIRNLNHHIDKHLLKEINERSGLVMNLKKVDAKDSFEKLVWSYVDEGNHGIDDSVPRKFKVSMDVTCNNENPCVIVDYKSIPIPVDEDESAIMD